MTNNEETITPFTIADKTIKECCRDKEIIEDVIFYLKTYLKREYGKETCTDYECACNILGKCGDIEECKDFKPLKGDKE